MKITLNDEEVRAALMKALEEKTSHVLGKCRDDDCYFTGIDSNDEEVEVVQVEFHCNSF
jgi:hypothetical protein